jgi:hypothetical protein
MSDSWLNIRIGCYHLQGKFRSIFAWSLSYNPYWKDRWVKNPVAIYDFRPGLLVEEYKYRLTELEKRAIIKK